MTAASAPEAERLLGALRAGRFPHALILEGVQPEKTAALASLLARAAVCLSGDEKPCGRCAGCVKAQAGSHPDLTVLDGDADPRAFPVDAVRRLRADAFIKPNEAPNRVFVLRGVQNMSELAQNALLKVFEEPPAHVFFLLTTVSAAALLPTVRSRAQIVSLSGGRPETREHAALAAEIAGAVPAADGTKLLFLTAALIRDKDALRSVLSELLLIFRDAAVLRSGGTTCLSGQEEKARALGGLLTRAALLRLTEEIRFAQQALDRNANAALLVTALCANFRAAAGR